MVMTVTTETGSIYEIDPVFKRMRRMAGTHDPTPNQRGDGQWRAYNEITTPVVGERLIVAWGFELPRDYEAAAGASLMARHTVTSEVTHIQDGP
jgi:hypothetical protein